MSAHPKTIEALAAILNGAGYRQLHNALRAMRGGAVGFDIFRNPETRLKDGLVTFICREHTVEQIVAGCNAAGLSIDPANLPQYTPPAGEHSETKTRGTGGAGSGDADAAGQSQTGGQSKDGDSNDDDDDGEAGSDSATGQNADQGQQDDGSGEERNGESKQKIPVPPPAEGEHRHPIFDKVYRLVEAGLNVMLVGPAGCGKTYLFGQIARTRGRKYASISGSAGASESQLLGRLLPTGDGGKFEYHPAPFVSCYEGSGEFDGGGDFLLDEIDAFDSNMLVVTNSATANGSFFLELRSAKPRVTRHANSRLMAAANTYGVGAGAMYVGRNQLDAATLDRWYIVEMDYDRAYEATLGRREIVQWVWKLRELAQKNNLRRVVSTRMIQKMASADKAGLDMQEIKRDVLAGWTRDELAKVDLGKGVR